MEGNDYVKEIKYGKMPIKKYKVSNHYHVIVDSENEKYLSVGLTSDKPDDKKNQKLHKVYESNGKVARLKRNVTIDKTNKYSKKNASFNVDTETESKVLEMAKRKKK